MSCFLTNQTSLTTPLMTIIGSMILLSNVSLSDHDDIITPMGGAHTTNCDETYSCSNTTHISNRKVNCNGYQSCENINIECNRNCAMNGANSGSGTSIVSHRNLRCNGYYSCSYTQPLYVSNNFYCDGYLSVIYSSVTVLGDAYLRTEHCFWRSNITGNGNNELIINGFRGCSQSVVRNFPYITVSGLQSIRNSEIYSNGIDITVDFDGNSASGLIYCEDGDTCIINCNSYYGCLWLGVFYHSNSNYQINCNNNCSYCDVYQQQYNNLEELKQSKQYLQHKMKVQKELEMINSNDYIYEYDQDDEIDHEIDEIENEENDDIEESYFGRIGNKILSKEEKIELVQKISKSTKVEIPYENNFDKLYNNHKFGTSINDNGINGINGIMGFDDDEIISITIGLSLAMSFTVFGYVLTAKK